MNDKQVRPDNSSICVTCGHTALDHGSHGRCEHLDRTVNPAVRCHCEDFKAMTDGYFIDVDGPGIKLVRSQLGVTTIVAEYFGLIAVDDILTLRRNQRDVTVSVNDLEVIKVSI
jgi:hypothetical protein